MKRLLKNAREKSTRWRQMTGLRAREQRQQSADNADTGVRGVINPWAKLDN